MDVPNICSIDPFLMEMDIYHKNQEILTISLDV